MLLRTRVRVRAASDLFDGYTCKWNQSAEPDEPDPHMLGIVVPYWNPFGNKDRHENLGRCLRQLRSVKSARVLCVEFACGAGSGLADIVVTGAPDAVYIWQKERLINHGCEILAQENIDRLGYVDADCLFIGPDWADRINRKFECGYNVIQGFGRATNGIDSVSAALAAFPELGARLHGGAMFFERRLYEQVGGLYEYCIVGGGDFVFLMAVTGDLGRLNWIFPCAAYREHVLSWLTAFRGIDLRPGCAGNEVNILIHGNPQRSHRFRHTLLQDFSPLDDIQRGDALELTGSGARLLPRLRAYTAHRENRPDIITGDGCAGS